MLWTFGEGLITDDAGDLGYASYRGRDNHVYHGKRSPNHPSPMHHYQLGTLMCLAAQFLQLSTVAAEAQAISDDIISDEILEP
jgi:hypothetical protein